MKHIKKFNEAYQDGDDYSLEERRLERLRNHLSPFLTLPEMVKMNKDGKLDDMIDKTIETCEKLSPMVKRALADDVTLEELNKMYL